MSAAVKYLKNLCKERVTHGQEVEVEPIIADNLDEIFIVLDDNGEPMVKNEHGTTYNMQDLSDSEVELLIGQIETEEVHEPLIDKYVEYLTTTPTENIKQEFKYLIKKLKVQEFYELLEAMEDTVKEI